MGTITVNVKDEVGRDMNIQERYRKPIEEFVRRVLGRYRDEIEGIILFGSVARDEGKEDSDVDVLVVGDVCVEELVTI
jgi:predicted nucleotidyltransferase